MLVLWGFLLFSLGLMMLALGSWLVPKALENPAVAEGLGDLGIGTAWPVPVSALVMLVGAVMLCFPRRGGPANSSA